MSNKTFECDCESGRTGILCETKINYCKSNRCLNKGVCQSLSSTYRCLCLSEYYSGRYCQILTKKVTNYKIMSTSISYIGIIVIMSVAMFIVIMDVLKYCFDIDPTQKELEEIRQKRRAKMSKSPQIQRFVYVNASLKLSKETISNHNQSTV